jgi:hypothetical protein
MKLCPRCGTSVIRLPGYGYYCDECDDIIDTPVIKSGVAARIVMVFGALVIAYVVWALVK